MARRSGAVFMAAVVLVVLPITAVAAPSSAAVVSRFATTTSLTATQTVGKTPGKVTFEIKVNVTAGARAHGQVHLSVDGVPQVSLVLQAINRSSYTGHYKVGTHSASAVYSGTSTDRPSSATITFTVS
jgi:hypothetical protein